MLKLLYFAIFISLTTLLACSGPETSSSPTAVAQPKTQRRPKVQSRPEIQPPLR